MPRIVDRVATAEGALVLGDDPPVLADDDAVGEGVDVDRAADRARAHRISVVVEPHEAGRVFLSRVALPSAIIKLPFDAASPSFPDDGIGRAFSAAASSSLFDKRASHGDKETGLVQRGCCICNEYPAEGFEVRRANRRAIGRYGNYIGWVVSLNWSKRSNTRTE